MGVDLGGIPKEKVRSGGLGRGEHRLMAVVQAKEEARLRRQRRGAGQDGGGEEQVAFGTRVRRRWRELWWHERRCGQIEHGQASRLIGEDGERGIECGRSLAFG